MRLCVRNLLQPIKFIAQIIQNVRSKWEAAKKTKERPVYVAGPGKRSNAELREVLSKWDKGGLAPLTIKQQVCGLRSLFLHRFAGGGGGGEVEMRCTGDVAQASRTHLTGSLKRLRGTPNWI